MGKLILYHTKRRISLTLQGLAKPNWNHAMYSPDFRAYKGAKTEIEFVIRDMDRKPIVLSGMTLIAVLVDSRNNETLAVIPLEHLNDTKGLVRMTITPKLIRDFPLGNCHYTVQLETPEGPRHLYVDQFDEARGFFEVREGAYPEAIPSIELDAQQFMPINVNQITYRASSPKPGNLQAVHGSRLHTVAVYTEEFRGKFWIEGSLESDTAPAEHDWFPLLTGDTYEFEFTGQSGIEAFNVESHVYWIRFRYLADSLNQGKLVKILLRN